MFVMYRMMTSLEKQQNKRMIHRILVIEDEPSIAELIAINLSHSGFIVERALQTEEAMRMIRVQRPDLLILDWMMPGKSGIQFIKELRSMNDLKDIPILMLTAKGAEADKIHGLDSGADDYVTKPYSSRELIARIRAVLRRRQEPEQSSGLLAEGPVRMDIERHVVSVNNVQVSFPLKEFELLEFLMRNAGRVLTRTQLIDRVWGSDYVGDTKTLDVHIKRLRSKIERDPAEPEYILTVRGLGYKFAN